MQQTFNQTLETFINSLIFRQRLIEYDPEVSMSRYHLHDFDIELVFERKRVDIPCSRKHLLTRQHIVVRFQHLLLDCVNTHVQIIFTSVRICQLSTQFHHSFGNGTTENEHLPVLDKFFKNFQVFISFVTTFSIYLVFS